VSAPAIALTNVTKRFGSHVALDNISVEISTGDTAVVLGPSGCGKTTLLRVIAGLEVPNSGEILLNGVQVTGGGNVIVPPHQRGLGFVFQDLALWPHLTVQENLAFVLESGKVPRAERRTRALEALRLVRVEALSARSPHELSGGEQQRVALARAIVGQPRILLLDEPLASLDAELRSVLRAELARLRRALDLTMVYVTHDREDAAALANRVIEMRASRIISVHDSQPREERA
jgi:ABC-type Fe3+/spermidine/putrescine transport system ATPase subunit